MTKIIDGRKIRNEILEDIKKDLEILSFQPVFCDILVGGDPVSASYVKIKEKTAVSLGIKFRTIEFGNDATTESIIEEIENLNRVPYMCGIIVQLPLPIHIDKEKVLDVINEKLDVDCLSHVNSDKFYNNEESIIYPTALACIEILDRLKIDLKDKKILVLGQGILVGKPVTHLLRQRGCSVDVVNTKTENTEVLIKNADIIISAIGKGGFIKGYMIKEGAVIIDAGTSEDDGAVVGDIDIESVTDIASYVSPTPGGVGPVTVAMLLKNVLKIAKQKI